VCVGRCAGTVPRSRVRSQLPRQAAVTFPLGSPALPVETCARRYSTVLLDVVANADQGGRVVL
jgi:hypothetical protein